MDSINRHLSLFPTRLRNILKKYDHWDQICEIRLRMNAPLSLTSFQGNVTLNENGRECPLSHGITCEEDELSYLLGGFCGGSVYRYFERLKDGFAVDEDGWRMGICTPRTKESVFLPNQIFGINLRIPRQIPFAAKPIVEKMTSEGIFSLLVCSAPGEGKTTLLRSLGALLSLGGEGSPPLRVAVVDEREELFPSKMNVKTGLLDVLPAYEKSVGIQQATRLFSPQVILCDEIGSPEEAQAVLHACSGGCTVIASAHAATLSEAKRTPALAKLLESGKFRYAVFLEKIPGESYRSRFQWEKLQ
jgi:stage III sporulation protein AA